MSDLISRSALIEAIKHHKENVGVCIDGKSHMEMYQIAHKHIIELVEIQPTAYNTDKIVEQLEEYQDNNSQNKSTDDYELGVFNTIEKTIEIVKAGGVDE